MKIRSALVLLVLGTAGFSTSMADASTAFSGIDSSGKSAMAEFSVTASGELIVTFTNTSMADVLVPSDLLTCLLFDVSGPAMALTRVSGVLGAGSSVFYDADGQPADGVIGGEWAYRGGLSGAPGGRLYGISSTGLNLFGPHDLFPGPDLQSPASPGGMQYGLLSAGDDAATGNGGLMGSGGLIKNSVVFTLGGAGADFDVNRIGNVQFRYGTSLGQGEIEGTRVIPSPGSGLLIVAGLCTILRRRR